MSAEGIDHNHVTARTVLEIEEPEANGRDQFRVGQADVPTVDKGGDGDGSFSTVHDDVEAHWDADGDNGVWWTVFEDFGEAYVEIDPMVTDTGGESDD